MVLSFMHAQYDSIKACCKNKLKSLHFRLLRKAYNDHYQQQSKEHLSKRCRRTTPDKWVRYCAASLVIKTLRDKNPCRLHSLLRSSYFEEPRKVGYMERLAGNLLTADLITHDLLTIPGAVKTCLTIQHVSS